MAKLQRTMRISTLIAALQGFADAYGDMPVYLDDPQTGAPVGITAVHRAGESKPGKGAYVAIDVHSTQETA